MIRLFNFLILCFLALSSMAQTQHRDSILSVAREVIKASKTCALITIDSLGQIQARTMDPFPPESDMTIWLATNPLSRKVAEIQANPNVNLYYRDADNTGYVSIIGSAALVDDKQMKLKYWKEEWTLFYPDQDKNYLLIRIDPVSLELVSESKKILPVDNTWGPVTISFE